MHPSYYPQVSGDLLSRVNLFKWYREFLRNTGMEKGYYIEFGVLNGESIVDVYRQLRGHLTHIFGFDSFGGLPPIVNEDDKSGQKVMPITSEGNFKSLTKDEVSKLIALSCRIPPQELTLVEGFFEESLPKFDQEQFKDKGPLLGCYIDCTLYSATRLALEFIQDKIVDGTWLFFDDYWCYRGSPKFGPRKAIAEWLEKHDHLGISEYSNFRGFGKAFIAHRK